MPNFLRKPYGQGWALIGDAGYTKDAITAQGILDAFRDAEACAEALDVAFRGSCSVDEALRAFHAARDHEVLPMYGGDLGCGSGTRRSLIFLDNRRPEERDPAMVVHAAFGTRAVFFALLSALALGCNRATSEPAPAASAAAAIGTAQAEPQNQMKERAKAGFPACLVGKWKSTRATLQVAAMHGEGGENVKLEIDGTGKSTIDFGEMAEVHASTPAFKFDFRYSGKATATLIADSETITSNDADWSGLRVSATANIPGIGKMPLVQDTPVSQLATLGKGVADSLGIDSAAPPSAPPAPQGIDASPVLSSSSYTCSDGTLKITSKQTGGASWEFAKQPG